MVRLATCNRIMANSSGPVPCTVFSALAKQLGGRGEFRFRRKEQNTHVNGQKRSPTRSQRTSLRNINVYVDARSSLLCGAISSQGWNVIVVKLVDDENTIQTSGTVAGQDRNFLAAIPLQNSEDENRKKMMRLKNPCEVRV